MNLLILACVFAAGCFCGAATLIVWAACAQSDKPKNFEDK